MSEITYTDTEVLSALFDRLRDKQYEVARTNARIRKAKLRRLHKAMLEHRDAICEAMWKDFRKGPAEVDISEIITVNSEIRHALKNLSNWMQPEHPPVRLPLFTTRAEIRKEPKGVCLIISPWNFPFNLSFIPLVGAIAAGNTVVIKPSEHTPHSSALIRKIVEECFDPDEVVVVTGGVDESKALLDLPFNHIYFTGSTEVGKVVMTAAAKHLSSVTLELGGKNPVIIDETADLDRAASRIMWHKSLNAGQICITADYLFVHESVKNELLKKLEHYRDKFYGAAPKARSQNPDICHLVHKKHFERAQKMLKEATDQGANVVFGGYADPETNYLDLTVLTNVPESNSLLQEEIFCPLLPVKTYTDLNDTISYINRRPKPLAIYMFSNNKKRINHVINETRGGGVCINELSLQFFNPNQPFGGHNDSGLGQNHGKYSFDEFSHQRSVTFQNRWFASTRFFLPPYKGRLFDFLIKVLSRYV